MGAPGSGARGDAQGVPAEEHGALALRWAGANVSELWWADLCSQPAHLWATSDSAPRFEAVGTPQAAGVM